MNGREIINHIVREEMPDLEQVRNICVQQSNVISCPKRIRWSVAAAFAAVLVLATAAYAVGIVINRLDTGGGAEFIMTPYDSPEYQEHRANMVAAWPLYVSNNSPESVLRVFSPDSLAHFDADATLVINKLLAGRIFIAYGTAFELMAAVPSLSGVYQADSRGNVLFNEDGYEIGIIYVNATLDKEPVSVDIFTLAEIEGGNAPSTHDEARVFLGRDFRLPTAYTDGFQPPRFYLSDLRGVVHVRYMREQPYGYMHLTIEHIRGESEQAIGVFVADGEITALEIAEATVYRIDVGGVASRFVWQHDGLVYVLYPSRILTDLQHKQIIRSMLE